MEITAVFAPLIGFLLAFLFGKNMGDKGAQLVTCAGIIIAAFASCYLFTSVVLGGAHHLIHSDGHGLVEGGDAYVVTIMNWISSGAMVVDWSLRIDTLSVVMMCVVTIVSSCVHVYSIGYICLLSRIKQLMARID